MRLGTWDVGRGRRWLTPGLPTSATRHGILSAWLIRSLGVRVFSRGKATEMNSPVGPIQEFQNGPVGGALVQPTADTEISGPVRVLVATEFYDPAFRGGGPIQTLKALIAAAPAEFYVNVICANHDLGDTAPLVDRPNEWLPMDRSRVCYVVPGLRSLVTAYRSAADVDIVYLNSLFNPRYSILPIILNRFGLWRNATILLAPRGELSPGALALKQNKKRVFLRTFKTFGISRRILWHASTEEEANHVLSVFGKGCQIVVRENETSLPLRACSRPQRVDGEARVLFASRLVPKKGLHTLLDAFADVTAPVRLDIVGSFEDSAYESRCRTAAERLPSSVSVTFHGALPRDHVLLRMREADIMAFPTAGENFGHVIAEALSESCPVMCSTHTPWTERLSSGGGSVVLSNTPKAWASALNDYLASGPAAWGDASQRAGQSFDKWRSADKGRHVFELSRQHALNGYRRRR